MLPLPLPLLLQAAFTAKKNMPHLFWLWLWAVGCNCGLQDRKVWEHKLHVAPRNLVAGDGPFAAYGRWLDQVRLCGVRSLVSLLLV